MKSFFKKLAFVMALAMVVSLAAPAAKTAVAAEDKKPLAIAYQKGAAITALNLADVGDEEDLRFVYAPENWKDLEVKWTSTNPNVVSVDNSGVVKAEAAGHAVVTVQVGDEYASIDVYSVDMVKFEATIGTQDGTVRSMSQYTMKVGDEFDFRFFGIYDYDVTRYKCQWLSLTPDVATVDDSGFVTAIAPGTAAITLAVSNQVVGETYVVAPVVITVEAEEEVVVAQPAIKAVQKTQNNFEIEFTDLEAANYGDDDIEVVRKAPADKDIDGNGVIDQNDFLEEAFHIKPVTLDKDNNKFIVDGYFDFIDGATYVVRVTEDYDYEFVASVGAVATMELTATDAIIASDGVAATPAYLSVKLFDKNGIDVSTVVTAGIINRDRVVYEMPWSDIAYQYGNEITFTAEGMVTASAYYDFYNITEKDQVEAKVNVIAKKHADYIAKVIAWDAVYAGSKINWKEVMENNDPLWVAAEDENYYIVALLEDTRGNYFTTHYEGTTAHTGKQYQGKDVYLMDFVSQNIGSSFVFAANGYTLEFASLNPQNLLMNADGEVVTFKETTSSIKLDLVNLYTNTRTEIASVPLQVWPERYIKYVDAGNTAIAAVTDTYKGWFDDEFAMATVTVKAIDQYKDKWYGYTNYVLEPVWDKTYTDTEWEMLKDYARSVSLPAAGSGTQEFKVTFDAEDLRHCLKDLYFWNQSNRNSVSFKLTEQASGRFTTIKVLLNIPNYVNNDEYTNLLKLDEKRTNNLDVVDSCTFGTVVEESAFFKDGKFVTADRKANINLYVTSKNYRVGYELDKLIVYNGSNRVSNYPGEEIVPGKTMMLVVTGPDNQVVKEAPVAGAIGVQVIPVLDTEDKNGNTATTDALYYKYELVTAAKMTKYQYSATNGALVSWYRTDEIDYLDTGKYTVQVRTVKSVWTDEKTGIKYFDFVTLSDTDAAAKTTNVKYITVTKDNDVVKFKTQVTKDLTESADNIYEVVANAFTFTREGEDWFTGEDLERLLIINPADYEVADGHVYVKGVTVRIPVDKSKDPYTNGYYTQWVPIGKYVKVSTDLFYWSWK